MDQDQAASLLSEASVGVGRGPEEACELQRYFADTQYCLEVQKLNFHEEKDTKEVNGLPGKVTEHESGRDSCKKDSLVEEAEEEGEVEQDVAKYINSKSAAGEGCESEVEDEDESDTAQETMLDSDPLSESDSESDSKESSPDCSSDDEDWRAIFRNHNQQDGDGRKKEPRKEKAKGCSSDEEDEDQAPKTKNEMLVLPSVPKVEVQLQPHHQLISIGKISSVLDVRVIVEGEENHPALDEGSILWLLESRSPLGFVDEVFGPVKKPFYVVRYNDPSEMTKEIEVDAPVGFVPDFAKTVLKTPELFKKGYDASGVNDEELCDDEVEFSDDEKEAEFKRLRKAKKGLKEDGHQESYDDNAKKRRPPRNFPRRDKMAEAQQTQSYYGQQNNGDWTEGQYSQENDPRFGRPPPQLPAQGYWPSQPTYFPGNYQPMGYPMQGYEACQQMQYQGPPGFYAMPMPGYSQVPPPNAMFVPGQSWWPTGPSTQHLPGYFPPEETRRQYQRPGSGS